MPPHQLKQPIGPFALTRTLAWLRLCAIAGQSMAVMICSWWMRIDISALSLFLGIDLLAVFAVFAAWRISQPWPVREWETVCHVAADTLVLGYLLYFTGGASNPFITLLLVPIALSAAALSVRAVLSVAAIAGAAYIVLLLWYVPLPMNELMGTDHGYSLHVAGMGVNFAVTALLLGFFINRLANAVRMQQLEVQRVRERALRDEGILAIATQAAGAAHELNTPLSTMRTLLPELRREHASDSVLDDDLSLLEGQVERCRTILREMVAFGKTQLSQEPEQLTLQAFIHGVVERFQLLRPEAEFELSVPSELEPLVLRSPPGLRHALINLLNNAVDASAMRGSHSVTLEVRRAAPWLEWIVCDHGPGFYPVGGTASIGESGKLSGLGIGLALAEATAERLNGELTATNGETGAEMRLRLPLSAITE
ncbi:ATP-binding protein [Dyella mobilis]|uniref:histidine kinase n=1 Tax=Dyella mobilis TaxID=1849582 RepID=A0ABS2KLT8_9GAMM|nr:ATP-binding protein [Dyella mobilis]MBM7132126.1 HAMP domain-containing histidine kinase [Dyella mobilis]GLQ95888.1 two-component sensor histidine kinase [Dyella mobilis]